jgi:uncharacterized protein
MRRKDREITERERINEIIEKAQVCRLGLCNNNQPYVVPVSFGYDGTFVYFHGAAKGMKIDYMLANNKICFEIEHDVKLLPNTDNACEWSQSFYSVIGFGTVQEVADLQRKIYAYNQIMKHYSGKEWEFDERELKRTRLWCITIESITGKHR